ncbi:MAG: IS1595 family transposase [Gammaproteobacteria bacterium]|nr:IS1595 family transposase [Gammaproteobacteria bacterium]
MTRKNRYFIRSRITEKKFREIIKLFSADLTAQQIALFSGVSRNCVNRVIKQVRIRMSEECEKESPFEKGEIEMDESYFGARRVRGKRGRGAFGKTIVFGLKKRKGNVYTQVIKNCSKTQILPLISSKISKKVRVFTDGFRTYDGLVDMGYKKHYRVHHGKNEFAKKEKRVKNHINGIENFWGIAKVRLYKFRGMDKRTFYLHLKECEFRFNHRQDNLYLLLLKMCRNNPLKVS